MKNRKTMAMLAAAIFASGLCYGLYWFGMQRGMQASGAQPAAAATASTDKKVLYWHDPMVPGPRFDKPGKSPFMDMQLVPVYADDAGEEGKVSISPRMQQNLGIRTVQVTTGNLASTVTAVGNVVYNERDVVLVQARSNGFVERLHVRAALDPVRKGQPLAELYVPEWVAAQEEYLAVKRMQGSGLDALASGARQRLSLAGMNDAQIRAVEAGGKVQARSTVTAPIGGVVAELAVREGMTVMAGAPLFRINGLGTIWIHADVPENVSAQVRPGTAAEVRTPSLPGAVFKGKVSAILPEVNAATRTLKARIELANPSGELVPGMFATVSFAAAGRSKVLLVPTEAVIQTGTRTVVMLDQGDGKFAPVEVDIGMEADGQTEIRKGLAAGQKVVVSGQFLIDSEASLKGSAIPMADPSHKMDAGATHRGEGKVEKIEKDEITLSHGPIVSLKWGPMTMGFRMPAGVLPKNLAPGDSVVFEFRQPEEGVYEITRITQGAKK
ncbi:MAG: efflux RND transporter periplasmic adaptor subunit [Pseudomonadota bacterium]